MILKPNNGSDVVIVNKPLYFSKAYEIVNGTCKLKRLTHDPKIQREGDFQRYLRPLKKKGFFTTEPNDKIYPGNSKPQEYMVYPIVTN